MSPTLHGLAMASTITFAAYPLGAGWFALALAVQAWRLFRERA